MSNLKSLTSAQLHQAAGFKAKFTTVEKELAFLLGSMPTPPPGPKKKFKMSATSRAKIAAAQKARWAKVKGAGKPSL